MCLQCRSLPSFHSPPTRVTAWCQWSRPSGPGIHTRHLHALIKVSPAPQHLPPRTDAAALRREIDGARSRRNSGCSRASAAREARRGAVCSGAIFICRRLIFSASQTKKRRSGCFKRRESGVGMRTDEAGGALT